MNTPTTRSLTLFVFLGLYLSMSGCASIKDSWAGQKMGISPKSGTVLTEPTVVDSATIQFGLESAKLDKTALSTIDSFGQKALEHAPATLIITGYTDITGSEKYNDTLSLRRAVAVKARLDSLSIKDINIKALGQGEQSPIADNKARSGRQKNRRAELTLLKL